MSHSLSVVLPPALLLFEVKGLIPDCRRKDCPKDSCINRISELQGSM